MEDGKFNDTKFLEFYEVEKYGGPNVTSYIKNIKNCAIEGRIYSDM